MICDFCFAITPNDLEEVPEPLKLKEDTDRMCAKCLEVFVKKLWLLDDDHHNTNRVIGGDNLTEEDIDVLYKQIP
jgi:hypothetical protein